MVTVNVKCYVRSSESEFIHRFSSDKTVESFRTFVHLEILLLDMYFFVQRLYNAFVTLSFNSEAIYNIMNFHMRPRIYNGEKIFAYFEMCRCKFCRLWILMIFRLFSSSKLLLLCRKFRKDVWWIWIRNLTIRIYRYRCGVTIFYFDD